MYCSMYVVCVIFVMYVILAVCVVCVVYVASAVYVVCVMCVLCSLHVAYVVGYMCVVCVFTFPPSCFLLYYPSNYVAFAKSLYSPIRRFYPGPHVWPAYFSAIFPFYVSFAVFPDFPVRDFCGIFVFFRILHFFRIFLGGSG